MVSHWLLGFYIDIKGYLFLRAPMNPITQTEAEALASFVESSLQSFAIGGGNLTGAALVAALDPNTIPCGVTQAYLSLATARGDFSHPSRDY